MFQRLKVSPPLPPPRASLIQTVPRSGDTLYAFDPPTMVGLSMKSVMNFRSLQTYIGGNVHQPAVLPRPFHSKYLWFSAVPFRGWHGLGYSLLCCEASSKISFGTTRAHLAKGVLSSQFWMLYPTTICVVGRQPFFDALWVCARIFGCAVNRGSGGLHNVLSLPVSPHEFKCLMIWSTASARFVASSFQSFWIADTRA